MKQFCVLYFLYEMVEFSQKNGNTLLHYQFLTKALKGHFKKNVNLNLDNLAPTMGVLIGITIYVKTQFLAKTALIKSGSKP